MKKPKTSTLSIFEQVAPETPFPFRIVENYVSLDGWRSRMSHESFATLKEAQHFVKEAEE